MFVPSASGTVRRHRDRELDAALSDLVGGRDDPAVQPVAATGFVVGHALSWRGAAGYADRERAVPARSHVDYRYRIGSVSKTFTTTMVLQLVGEGRLGLDDPVRRHLPGVVPGDDRMTVRHLLGMTSGLADYVTLLNPTLEPGNASYREFLEATRVPIAPRDLIDMAVEKGLTFEPGQHFEYCTTNYLVLGLMLERATGTSYADALHRRILGPLRLRDTSLPQRPDLRMPFLRGYGHFDDRPEEWVDVSFRYEQGWSGGGIVSTLRDVGRFLGALNAGRLLPPDLLTEMRTPAGAPPVEGGPSGENYGLGLERYDHPGCGELWGNGGQTHGYVNTVRCTSDGRLSIGLCYTGFPVRQGGPADPAAAFLDAALALSCPAG
jgi:D-alanyl-D-alanine carboxypeptidase